ncbi:nucleoside triphosphate pyrophosphohydrolase family protein [Pelagibacteraceae bacterium]|jgi:predicted HAD superfamily Cof-like phosphohydrolase|nr:nucleoside triphosphate pyrophosphohydrolase family protein [Pelagibacteraceae bacterium]|tara:strand:- start:183 stop:569 length:387 start_codon:yes stop_codon:yes gene_type:complete
MSDMSNFNKVKAFMNTYGQDVNEKASFPEDTIVQLRVDLIEEELNELKEAIKNNDLVEVADALTDILYVTYGAGHSFGVDLDKCFDEVQRSNMSKLGEDGNPIYNESGKVMKGPNYSAPDLKKIIELD